MKTIQTMHQATIRGYAHIDCAWSVHREKRRMLPVIYRGVTCLDLEFGVAKRLWEITRNLGVRLIKTRQKTARHMEKQTIELSVNSQLAYIACG